MATQPCFLVIGAPRMSLSLPCDTMPPAGGSVALSGEPLFEPGDRGTAAAAALSRLGARAIFCGAVGDDTAGRSVRDRLIDEGVDIRFLRPMPEGATAIRCLVREGVQCRGYLWDGVSRQTDKELIDEAFAALPDALCLFSDLPPAVMAHAITRAAQAHIPVFMDACGGEVNLLDLPQVTAFVANADECEHLTGERPGTADQCLRTMLALPRRVRADHFILKLGERGCFFLDGRLPRYLAACGSHPNGGTGAGTVFFAALSLLWLQSGGNLLLSCKYANAAAAAALERPGLYLPTQREIAAFLQQN